MEDSQENLAKSDSSEPSNEKQEDIGKSLLAKSDSSEPSNEKQEDIGKSLMDCVFNEIPEPIKEKLIFAASHYSGPVPNPIVEKMTSSHITSIIDTISKDEDNSYKLKREGRIYSLIYIVLFLGLLIFLICFLIDKNPEFLKDFFYKGLIFFGGAGGGYGYKAYLSKKKK